MSSNIFIENSTAGRSTVKQHYVKTVPYCCVICSNKGQHNSIPLTLELDHINGIRNDNRLFNLRLLCPNCHSQQKTSNRRINKPKFNNKVITIGDINNHIDECGSIRELILKLNISDSGANYTLIRQLMEENGVCLKPKAMKAGKYVYKHPRGDTSWRNNDRPSTEKITWPTDDDLAGLVFSKPLIKLAKDIGVSDNAIRKRCKKRDILLPKQGYWLKK
tara:strand:+ start:152 stop:808 length:657 start_codon:yes stop_codon:yes gene_type:complete